MRNRAWQMMRAPAVCAGLVLLTVAFALARDAKAGDFAPASVPQDKAKETKEKPAPKVAEKELQAAKTVEAAADVAATLAAAGEFLQKYPKSALRPQVAQFVAGKISNVTDAAQQIAHGESYLKLFNAAGEADFINPYLISSYTVAKRLDEAFALAAAALPKTPDPVAVMINLTLAGTEEARKQNLKYAAQSQQYGTQAIELIEGGKKPAAVNDTTWVDYKTRWVPLLYQTLAMLSLANGDKADAKTRITKAAALNPSDPVNYAIIGSMANNEYQRLAQEHKAATGAQKDELLKQAQAQMDQIIDAYAHALALADGNAQYGQLRDQLGPDLEAYYKYRHNNSTEGLQALIDKYKKR
ncbi:MAG: hypothetical protein ACR2G4_13305 [Pyrinomonadaceae bacterium]